MNLLIVVTSNTDMANFRAERLFIRVAGVLDFDPNEGIDANVFAFATVCDADAYDQPSLQDHSFAPFDRPRWFRASHGLTTVRAVIAEEEAMLGSAHPSSDLTLKRRSRYSGLWRTNSMQLI